MSVRTGHAKLSRAAKDLFASWRRTKETWRDENSRQFEERYLSLLRSELRKAEAALERMDSVLHRVRHDCS